MISTKMVLIVASAAALAAGMAAPQVARAESGDAGFTPNPESGPPARLILASSRSRRAAREADARAAKARAAKVHPAKAHEPDAHDTGLVTADGPVETASGGSQAVVVKHGDTVESLADRLGVSKETIIEANGLRRPYHLEAGRKLRLPGPKVAKAYVVQHGDTLFAVSRRFNVPVPVLEETNHFEHGVHLRVGQRVALPGPPGAALRRSEESETEEAPPPKPAPPKPTPPKPAPPHRVTARLPATSQEQPPASTWTAPPPAAIRAPPPSAAAAPTRGPVPYNSLPGHLTGSYAPPQATQPQSTPSWQQPAWREPPREPPQRNMAPPMSPNGPPVVETTPPPTDAQIAAAGRGRFIWPVRGQTIVAFGPRQDGQRNDGVDIAAPADSAVMAAASGDVVYAGNQVPGFGNLVLIKHADGWVTAYAHLSATEVKIKDHVSQGTEIGRVGQTGGAAQPELHFEIRFAPTPRDKAKPVDPALVLGGQ